MDEQVGIYIVALVIAAIISYALAEVFGRGKHIGRDWTFALTLTTLFIGGVIALIASPSAKEEPTQGGKGYQIGAWVCFVFGALNTLMLNPLALGFFILGSYLWKLAKGEVVNDNPKYYFQTSSNFSFTKKNEQPFPESIHKTPKQAKPSEESNFQKQKDNLKNLYEKGLLSEIELQEKYLKVTDQQITAELHETEEYQQLSELYKAEVLDSGEFEEKLKNLKEKLRETNKTSSEKLNGFQSKYHMVGEFVEGLAKVWDEESNYGFIDERDNMVITPKYEFAEDFNEELALVRINRQFGFIDKEGHEIIPASFDEAESFSGGKARVKKGKEFFYIDKEGNKILT